MTKKPKILVLTTTFPRWRADSTPPFVFNLCQNLLSDFKIIVLAPHYYQAEFEETIRGIKIYRFPYFIPFKWQKLCYEGGILANLKAGFLAKLQVPFLFFFEAIFTCRLVRKEKPALIHAHWTIPQGIIALILKKFLDLPVLVTPHAADVFTKSKIMKLLNQYVAKKADYLTFTSQAAEKTIRKEKAVPRKLVFWGINTRKFRPFPKERKRKNKNNLGFAAQKIILFVGRLAEKKGVSYLIKAMPAVLRTFKNSRLLIIGFGPKERPLKKLVYGLKLEKKVNFLGKIANDKLANYYNLADVFVTPSIRAKEGDQEGLPNVILEAMASATAIISTDTGGISDLIKHKKTGLLVNQKSSKELAGAIVSLLKNKKLREKLAKNARKHVETNFDWEIIARKFKKIYNQILDEEK
jgi:phosphatidylinositol alpha-1,6-mannosyltransferase